MRRTCIVCVALLIVAVLAATGTSYGAKRPLPPVIPASTLATLLPSVVADNGSSSPLTITNTTAYISGYDYGPNSQTVGDFVYNTPAGTAYTGVACFDFINHGPRPVTKATFAFSAADAGGAIINVGSASINGPFAVNDDTPAGLARAHVCLNYATLDSPVIGRFFVSVRTGLPGMWNAWAPAAVAEILVSARLVTYDDGSTWNVPQPPQAGQHVVVVAPSPSPASPGWPVVRAVDVAAAPFRMMNAFTYVTAQAGLSFSSFRDTGAAFGVCAAMDAGDSPKEKQAQLAIAYIAAGGTVAAVDTITMHGGRYYGECRSSPGSVKDGTFIYNIRRGAPSTPIANVIVTQLSENFANGTTWTNPAPPVAGAQAP